ncbi:hypothetical protein CRUP_034143, partial [Coryphaenoides rupestris]
SREQSDDEQSEDSVKFKRLHKLVNSTRRVRKKLIKVDEGKRRDSEDSLSLEALPIKKKRERKWDNKKKNKSFWQNFRKAQHKPVARQTSKGTARAVHGNKKKNKSFWQNFRKAQHKPVARQTSKGTARAVHGNTSHDITANETSREQSDDEQSEDSVKFKRLHKLVNSTRRVRKKLIKVDEGKRRDSEDSLSLEASPTCEDNVALYTGVLKKPPLAQDASLAQDQLSLDGDTDSLTTSPSSSSLDTWSGGHKLVKTFSKSSSAHGLIRPPRRGPATGPAGVPTAAAGPGGSIAAVVGSGSSISELDGCGLEEEGKLLSRSPADGEMRKALSSISHGRTCSFGGFDLSNRSLHVVNAGSEANGKEQEAIYREVVKSPTTSRISLGRKVKSVKE